MPWDIKKNGSKYQVVKRADGTVAGTHDNYGKATRQLAALHVHMKGKEETAETGRKPSTREEKKEGE